MIFTIFRDIVPNYLSLILTWPVVILIVFIVLKDNISKFIDEIGELGWGNNKIRRKDSQTSIEPMGNLNGLPTSKWDWKNLFLDLFIKPNTLQALKWFYDNPGHHSSSEFGNRFIMNVETGRDETEEKNAIISALRDTDLINTELNKYYISEDGNNYLRYKGII